MANLSDLAKAGTINILKSLDVDEAVIKDNYETIGSHLVELAQAILKSIDEVAKVNDEKKKSNTKTFYILQHQYSRMYYTGELNSRKILIYTTNIQKAYRFCNTIEAYEIIKTLTLIAWNIIPIQFDILKGRVIET